MKTRRDFLAQAASASVAIAATPLAALAGGKDKAAPDSVTSTQLSGILHNEFHFPQNFGIGGVGLGNGFHENSNDQIQATLQAAWDAGVRYYDTSPFYGYGLSERRLGHFLFEKNRADYLLSTKIGRVFEADPAFKASPANLWKGQLNFKYSYDYTAAGVRRSIEDSLQRLGLSSIDMVLVHDLSPDTPDQGAKWLDHFAVAAKGAFPELTRMREEGIIKSWGMGVNTPEPILKALEVADPDIMLVAIQYSLLVHKNALNVVFPAMQQKKVKAIIGGPLNAGFLANRDRFNYGGTIPPEMVQKREAINTIIKTYNIDLRTVALQFCAAHPVVGAVIPGASTAEQAKGNAEAMKTKIPAQLWEDLKKAKLIEQNAPVPA